MKYLIFRYSDQTSHFVPYFTICVINSLYLALDLIFMAKEEYKQLSCSDVGMACGFQVRAKTEEEVMEHARAHAAKAHGLKKISPNTENKIKSVIKTVSVDVPEKK